MYNLEFTLIRTLTGMQTGIQYTSEVQFHSYPFLEMNLKHYPHF